MQVLVTGGNGFVGHHLIPALIDRGDDVRVLALPDEDVSTLDGLRVSTFRGDVLFQKTLPEAFEGVDAVIHLAAMMHVWRPLADYRRVNVDGTVNVCRTAMAAGVSQVVHMSSSCVYGTRWRGLVDETFPLNPFGDPYSLTKAEGDLAVQRMTEEEGLRSVIIRPDQIFGPGDRLHFGHTADRLRAGRGIVVGRGNNYLPLVHVSDVVQALLLAVDQPQAVGGVFNITNDAPLTQKEFLDAVAAGTGGMTPRIRVPKYGLYLAAIGAERYAKATRGTRRPPITRLGVAFLAANVRFSVAKARRVLEFEPQVDLREGIRQTATWYLEDASRGSGVDLARKFVAVPIAGASEL